MSEEINPARSRFFATTAMTIAAARTALLGSASAPSHKLDRLGSFGSQLRTFFDAIAGWV